MVVNSGCHAGTYCARLGNTTPPNGDSTISQTFTVPNGTTVVVHGDLPGHGHVRLGARHPDRRHRGHTYMLTLTSHDDNYSADPTYTLFDDVTLN